MLATIFSLFILGCSSSQNDGAKYYVLVVEGENNISGTIAEFVNIEHLVVEMEYLTSLEQVQNKYPDYEIKKAPAVFIFETGGGEFKKLKLKTYDVEKAIEFLRDTKN